MRKYLRKTIDKIRAGQVDPVYFLNGDDFFLQSIFIEEIERSLGKDETVEKSFEVPNSGDFDRILAELNSASLFVQKRLFVLQNPTQIKGKSRELFLAYCDSPNPINCLVIIIDKYDPQNRLVKSLAGKVGVISSSPPFPEKMAGWARFLMKKNDFSATDEAIDTLIALSGDSVYHLNNEIEKIKLSIGELSTIEEADVLKHSGWVRNFYPWHFVDAIGRRDFGKTVKIGKNLMDQGRDISSLISLMTTLFQELLFRRIDSSGEKEKDRQWFWLSSQVRKRLNQYEKEYGKERLPHIFRLLGAADEKVKSMKINPEAILVPLVYKVVKGNV
ncbi:MAG: DNA polymerase III subunit delta [Candidatus Marinimicrobia bacterium]|jgi:DNA polymerase III delta subunit|nr:DNA polymerase III subunit delta [Candidatus Neomarinimicrobiota bacterium]MDP6593842.1 DNA polymerase III subunit delta [Candidatus Neomarinimicrobiota bacterium]MDP6836860.1 DNA polymerase III subunit delta [Candidatus Neomarinimicrobiota bacterium]|tara:strand:+ start:5402 stop:6394 length:993 start_codon:yes stop_codon:yes gene_type:complete